MKPEIKAKPSFVASDNDSVTVRPGFVDELDDAARADDPLYGFSPLELAVRAAYVRERTRHETARHGTVGTYKVPLEADGRTAKYRGEKLIERAVKSTWQKIVELCEAERIDPQTYIATIFANLEPDAICPNPNYFHGQKALDRWYELCRGQEKIVELSLNLETSVAAEKMSYYMSLDFPKRRAYRTTLVDDTLNLSPLFRYCVARSLNYDDIAEHFYPTAVSQYIQFSAYYDKYWREFLPKGFARSAAKDFKSIMRGTYG